MGIKLTNNANATLAASINSSATSITLTSGQGARFPTLSAGDYFYATLVDTSNNLEIVKCTARSTDVLTVVRGQESTTARAYTTGDRIEIRLTAQTFIDAVAEIGPTQISDKANSSTGYFDLPSGTTAERPGTPAAGMVRHNTTIGEPEWYDTGSAQWIRFSGLSYTAEYLIVAGGGGGGSYGGGGAGGYIASSESLTAGQTKSITIGAGGAASPDYGSQGSNGQSSVYGSQSTVGGGGGANNSPNAGSTGGSGGGGGYGTSGGAGTAGQGSAGGSGANNGVSYSGGGGGGKNAVGANASSAVGGNGGAGLAWLNGTTYGGGGGGVTWRSADTKGTGGAGGGGNGGTWASDTSSAVQGGSAGSANTGGGGGGRYAGGSGVAIIRYLGAQRGTGGTVTSAGGYTYHTFTSSGTFTA